MVNQFGVIKQNPPINRIHPQDTDIRHFSTFCQTYQSYLSQRAYLRVIKEFEYKKNADYPLDNVLDIDYGKEELYKRDIWYTMKKPDEVSVNFFGVKLRCNKCRSKFFSKFLLHKYPKLNCIK